MSFYLLGIGHTKSTARFRSSTSAEAALCDVHWIAHEDLSAAVTRADGSSLIPSSHAALLASIHRRCDILPVRYGTALPDETGVRAFLARRYGSLLDALAKLEGVGEMGLRIEATAPAVAVDSSAADGGSVSESLPCRYMAARRRQYDLKDRMSAMADRAVHIWLHSLKDLYRDHRALCSKDPRVVRLTFLVDRAYWGIFARHCEIVGRGMPEVQCRLMGPWPPYSFV